MGFVPNGLLYPGKTAWTSGISSILREQSSSPPPQLQAAALCLIKYLKVAWKLLRIEIWKKLPNRRFKELVLHVYGFKRPMGANQGIKNQGRN